MSMRTVLVVLLALVFGTSAAIGVAKFRGGAAANTVGVVVAVRDIPRYTSLTPDMLKIQPYPKGLVPPGALTTIEEAIDRVAESQLIKDEPVMEGKLTPKGAGRGVGAAIPLGMRAVTIRTTHVAAAVAGLILPGSKVDVMFTMKGNHNNPGDPTGGGSTTTLVHNVEVLAMDHRIEAPADPKLEAKAIKELRSVTLLVTPDQAAKIDLAQNVGTLHLTLRNPLDTEPGAVGTATLAGIQSGPLPPIDARMKDVFASWSRVMAEAGDAWAKAEKVRAEERARERAEKEKAEKEKAEREKAEKAKLPVAPPPTPVVTTPPASPAPAKIRTLRSGIPGTVTLDE